MAPQRHSNGSPPWVIENDDNTPQSSSAAATTTTTTTTLYELPVESSTDTDVGAPVLAENPYYPGAVMPHQPPGPTAYPSVVPSHWPSEWEHDGSTTISISTASSETWQQQRPTLSRSSSSSSFPTPIATGDSTQSTSTDSNVFPGWKNQIKNQRNQTPLYAAAAVIPVAVLAIIGAIVFVCLRKRKRRRLQAAAAPLHAQEMKSQWKPTMQPYMAPSPPLPVLLPNYSPPPNYPASESPVSPPPIILGPISSGTNGNYMTGIDTSDMVSVTSARDPFADGRSLEEPPPPYRPRSMAPSSICPTSRHSSVRVAVLPPADSRTHLVERSPFEDPEDDNISELSGPTTRRDPDAISVISDLSYQFDPVVGRSPF
jgi:hypothetical protein